MSETVLVRYGLVPEVARFHASLAHSVERGDDVVVRTHRGLQLGTLLQPIAGRANGADTDAPDFVVVRPAEAGDRQTASELRADVDAQFAAWQQRIEQWKLELELIDLEWTLDRAKLILYVLNERGPDCTKLALHAAAAGLGLVEVQPVNGDGLVTVEPAGGGCGSGGCGCHE